MKKIIGITTVAVVIIAAILFIGSGFQKRTDVMLLDYSISEDGKTMMLDVMVTSSMGYTRDVKIKQGGDNLYLSFYNTFGFFNSRLGAKDHFEVALSSYCEEIYFYTGDGGYREVLQKDAETDRWKIVG